jgi:hypothetical protein
VKLTALSLLIALLCACATDPYDHYNRRDLYNPEDAWPGEIQPLQPKSSLTPAAKPQLRG